MFVPLLADFEDIVGIIFIVLSVLGIFVRAIKGENNAAPQPRRKDPAKTRTEIEEFLEEITGKTNRPPAREQPKRTPPVSRPPVKQNPKKANRKPLAGQPTVTTAPVGKLSEQHLQTSNLGGDLRAHLASYMQTDRVGQEVQRDLQSQIPQEVMTDLGRAAATAMAPVQPVVHPLVKLLRDPQGVRTAIALQEILQKPRSLR